MRHEDLGPDYYERRASLRRQIHHHVTHLESLGFEVTLCRTPDPNPAPQARHTPSDAYRTRRPGPTTLVRVRCRVPS